MAAETTSSYARVSERLAEIVQQIRSKDVPLEKSLDLYEEAIRLGAIAAEMIDRTDFTVDELAALESDVTDVESNDFAGESLEMAGDAAATGDPATGDPAAGDLTGYDPAAGDPEAAGDPAATGAPVAAGGLEAAENPEAAEDPEAAGDPAADEPEAASDPDREEPVGDEVEA